MKTPKAPRVPRIERAVVAGTSHWTPAEISAFLGGKFAAVGTPRRFALLRHLFRCPDCRTSLLPQLSLAFAPPPPFGDETYAMAVARAEKRALAQFHRLRQGEEKVRVELKRPLPLGRVLDYAQRAAAETATEPEVQLARARHLLEEGRALRQKDPQSALFRIAAAQQLSAGLRDTASAAAFATDLWIEAVAEEANVLRVTGDLPAAEKKFEEAVAAWSRSHRSTSLHLHLTALLSSYLIAARKGDEAEFLLKRVVTGYEAMKQHHLAGRALSKLAVHGIYFRSAEESIELLVRALERLDFEREPALVVSVYQNLIGLYAEVGDINKAADLLAKAEPLYEHFGDAIDQLKRLWLEGKIRTGLGQALHAEEKLTAAERGFAAKNLPYQRALVLLDLTALFLTQKKFGRAREIIEAAYATFVALHITREALAAILLLKDAVRQETATAAQVQAAVKVLARG